VESNQIPQETVTDGWYIDLDTSLICAKGSVRSFAVLTSGGPRKPGEPPQIPIISFKSVGEPETGYAVVAKELHRATLSLPDGSKHTREDITNEMRVTALSVTQLDPALFEIPSGFRKVDEIRRTPVLSYWTRLFAWLEYYWIRIKNAI
jgi:hypothetical protein